ncbi:MAG: flagellar biosynthesis regulator FlaF [Devosia sp.]
MHQHGAQAYQQTAKVVENPRQRESALLMKAAAGLQKVKDEWDISTTEDLRSALTFNRKLWTIFMSAVTQDDSPLPPEIRQNIANLGMFVMNQTREILYEDVPVTDHLTVLVQLNRQIAAGLRGM